MSDLSRRDAVRLAAALAAGAGGLAARATHARDDDQGTGLKRSADPELKDALQNPQAYMFREQVTFRLEGDGRSRNLVITSARNSEGHPEKIQVPSVAMRIFRADASQDAFTQQGGVYWRSHETEGKIQFKKPGPIVLIVRDHDDTVRCYALEIDLRC